VELIASIILGYLCGSIPFGLLLTKAAGLGDVRHIGSGNIGATNVLRTGSRPIAALTLLLDMLKGFVPVLLAGELWGTSGAIAAGFGALVGHIFPIWLRFRGGKGVATYIGVLAALHWPLVVIFIVVWLIVALASRRSSLAALIATAAVAAASFFMVPAPLPIALCVIGIAIYVTHRDNIVRLLRRQEPTIDFSKKV
jgi:glycerol-3-phosphate acyltransferase PlsY